MKTEEIIELFKQFESITNEYEGVECWRKDVQENFPLYCVMPNGATLRI